MRARRESASTQQGDALDDLRALGADADAAQAFVDAIEADTPEPDAVEIWPENWETVRLFMRLQTQWHYSEHSGAPVRLDYPAVEAVLRLARVRDRATVFEGLQVMEAVVTG